MTSQPQEGVRPPRDKLGLALSGGGFRAAFFHIGVLARLAERGRLRAVEVISTVSGGSIVGALLYLHVRDLLQAKEQPTDDDYVRIVERIEQDFLRATEANIRALATANLERNIRMARQDYSRSDRLGELYDELLYRPAWNDPLFSPPPEPRDTLIQMRELLVQPAGHVGPFNPEDQNHTRESPVPVLLLNATSLNTGHNWRFEAVAMGEPLRDRESWVEIDKNTRYARKHYDEITPKQAGFALGIAVAASACVPGLFHPLAVSDLFDGKRVQLVDGGVHDNQGVCGLFDTNCTDLIVSDASGQLSDLDRPPTRIPDSVGRSTRGVYGDRVREEQLSDAWRNYESVIVHLRRGLPTRTIFPRDPAGNYAPEQEAGVRPEYHVDGEAGSLLSRMRTDLDAFSEVEAYSLGVYGYAMTGVELERKGYARDSAKGTWSFQRLATALQQPSDDLLDQLRSARNLFFRSFRTGTVTNLVGFLLVLDGLLLGIAGVYWLAQLPSWLLVLLVVVLAVLLALYRSTAFRGITDILFTRVGPVVVAPFIWLGSSFTLALTPASLRAGRADRVT